MLEILVIVIGIVALYGICKGAKFLFKRLVAILGKFKLQAVVILALMYYVLTRFNQYIVANLLICSVTGVIMVILLIGQIKATIKGGDHIEDKDKTKYIENLNNTWARTYLFFIIGSSYINLKDMVLVQVLNLINTQKKEMWYWESNQFLKEIITKLPTLILVGLMIYLFYNAYESARKIEYSYDS